MTVVTTISEQRGVVTRQMAQSRSAEQAALVTGCAIVSAPREDASALITRAAGNVATKVVSVSRVSFSIDGVRVRIVVWMGRVTQMVYWVKTLSV